MPLFNSRPRVDGLEGVLQSISIGEWDDSTIKQLQDLVSEMSGDDVKSLADILMTNLVKFPDDVAVLIGSVEALESLPFLPKAKNEFIITLLLSLLKAPGNRKDALERKTLKREIIRFLLFFVSEDDSYAKHMMPELILALDENIGPAASGVFHVLQHLAVERPEYFERYSAALIKQLGSINKSTRAESAKLIGIIAKVHPEYVSSSMPFLQSLASFYPDAQVKRNANEAYQIIQNSVKREPVAPSVNKTTSEGKGLADIMKLNTGTTNGSPQSAQFTDDELKDIIELTRKEFKSDAEAILNSLGVGHLTVKSKENKARQKYVSQKPASEEIVQAIPVKVKRSIFREKPIKEEKVEADNIVTLQSDIDTILKRSGKDTAQKPSQGKDFALKCPKCGGRSWANGQLCDKCAGEEFDRKAVKGH